MVFAVEATLSTQFLNGSTDLKGPSSGLSWSGPRNVKRAHDCRGYSGLSCRENSVGLWTLWACGLCGHLHFLSCIHRFTRRKSKPRRIDSRRGSWYWAVVVRLLSFLRSFYIQRGFFFILSNALCAGWTKKFGIGSLHHKALDLGQFCHGPSYFPICSHTLYVFYLNASCITELGLSSNSL